MLGKTQLFRDYSRQTISNGTTRPNFLPGHLVPLSSHLLSLKNGILFTNVILLCVNIFAFKPAIMYIEDNF